MLRSDFHPFSFSSPETVLGQSLIVQNMMSLASSFDTHSQQSQFALLICWLKHFFCPLQNYKSNTCSIITLPKLGLANLPSYLMTALCVPTWHQMKAMAIPWITYAVLMPPYLSLKWLSGFFLLLLFGWFGFLFVCLFCFLCPLSYSQLKGILVEFLNLVLYDCFSKAILQSPLLSSRLDWKWIYYTKLYCNKLFMCSSSLSCNPSPHISTY